MTKTVSFILSIFLCFSAFGKGSDVVNSHINEGVMMNQSIIDLMKHESLLSTEELVWNPVLEKRVKHNKMDAILYRFEPTDSVNLHGTNFSMLVGADNGDLLGLSRMLSEYKKGSVTQVSKDTAKQTMIKFVTTFSPELLNNYKLQWIDEHDELFQSRGEKIVVSGMKVKCKDLNTGLYFWVIVAPDNTVMVFEKEIEWDFLRAGRQTQKWLHDSYLDEHNREKL